MSEFLVLCPSRPIEVVRAPSPYDNLKIHEYKDKTVALVDDFYKNFIPKNDLISVLERTWYYYLLDCNTHGICLWTDFHQDNGCLGGHFQTFFHAAMDDLMPGISMRGSQNKQRDLVCLKNDYYSLELKTHSMGSDSIRGTNSQGKKDSRRNESGFSGGKKASGFFLTSDHDYGGDQKATRTGRPKIDRNSINLMGARIGWIDDYDYNPSKGNANGSSIDLSILKHKLIPLVSYSKGNSLE